MTSGGNVRRTGVKTSGTVGVLYILLRKHEKDTMMKPGLICRCCEEPVTCNSMLGSQPISHHEFGGRLVIHLNHSKPESDSPGPPGTQEGRNLQRERPGWAQRVAVRDGRPEAGVDKFHGGWKCIK